MTTKKTPAAEMSAAAIDKELGQIKLERERLALAKDEILDMEKRRELCKISMALSQFNEFLLEFRDRILDLPDAISLIVPSISPSEYTAIQKLATDLIARMHEKHLHLELTDTRTDAEACTEINKNKMRHAAKLNGEKRKR